MINIKSIWESQKGITDNMIKTKINDIIHLNCYAATNKITGQLLYIMSFSKSMEIPELKNYKFKGVEIFPNNSDGIYELVICLLDNELNDIFSLFIQNIVEDIFETEIEAEALIKTLNVISKWKRLFDKINFNGLSIEQQKGLIGELLFFNYLIENKKSASSVLNAWTGPDNEDKDYCFGAIGVEIKLTSSKYPKIKITNEGQLDIENFTALFIVLYTVEVVKENGISLNYLVELTRQKLVADFDNLKFFNERLLKLGYLDDEIENYNKLYFIKNISGFEVMDGFPRLIKRNLPVGIYNTSYFVELSAIEEFQVDTKYIVQSIN